MIKLLAALIIYFSASNLFSQSGWEPVQVEAGFNLTYLFYLDSVNAYSAGNPGAGGGKIFRTINGGSNWTAASSFQLGIYCMHMVSIYRGYCMGGIHSFEDIRKTTGGTWFSIGYVPPATYNFVYFINNETGFALGTTYSAKTTNGGTNFINTAVNVNTVINMRFVNDSIGFAAGINPSTSSNTIAKTTDQGASWTYYDIPASCKKIDFPDANTGYGALTNGKVIKTTSQGASWELITLPETIGLSSLSFPTANTGYALGFISKVFKTTNGGVNWTVQQLPISSQCYSISFSTPANGLISCSNGFILRTTNGGEVLGITQLGGTIPGAYTLSQNYPNPFNPVTNIKFDIPSESHIELNIYDALGRKVEGLVNQNLRAGSYSVDWNASAYSSGVYFYKITAGEFTQTRKMVLIK